MISHPLPSAICHMPSLMPAHAALLAEAEQRIAEFQAIRAEYDNSNVGPIVGKYIIVERDGHEFPLVFSRTIQHSDLLTPKAGKPISAGFYQFFPPNIVIVNGESSSLNLSSRPQDSAIIKRHLLFLH